tara:strand:- start:114 stop:347 length:234 start_codon:yes stop_codon:yes gene_type:complete
MFRGQTILHCRPYQVEALTPAIKSKIVLLGCTQYVPAPVHPIERGSRALNFFAAMHSDSDFVAMGTSNKVVDSLDLV